MMIPTDVFRRLKPTNQRCISVKVQIHNAAYSGGARAIETSSLQSGHCSGAGAGKVTGGVAWRIIVFPMAISWPFSPNFQRSLLYPTTPWGNPRDVQSSAGVRYRELHVMHSLQESDKVNRCTWTKVY